MSLIYNPETHTYEFQGIRLPSATQVINEWVLSGSFYVHTLTGVAIPAQAFEYAGSRGSAVHKGCKLIMAETIDWDSVEEEIVPPLLQFQAWKEEYYRLGDSYISETPMMSEKHQFAGTADLILPVSKEGKKKDIMSIVEIKSSKNYGQVAAQLAAYEVLYREYARYTKPIVHYVLDLSGERYKFLKIEDSDAWSFFLHSLNRCKYLQKQGVNKK